MTAIEKLYLGATEADRTAFRTWFLEDKDGEKAADTLSKEALTAAKDTKMTLKKWEIGDVSVDSATLATGTTEVSVEENQKGKPRCIYYKLEWKNVSGTWRRVAQKDFRIVACNAP